MEHCSLRAGMQAVTSKSTQPKGKIKSKEAMISNAQHAAARICLAVIMRGQLMHARPHCQRNPHLVSLLNDRVCLNCCGFHMCLCIRTWPKLRTLQALVNTSSCTSEVPPVYSVPTNTALCSVPEGLCIKVVAVWVQNWPSRWFGDKCF